ncbi:MAG: helix-turn-helix transcriptional regulator [Methanobacteriota archaeon]|nr:MAG: helix-turn-helix transcriptional regulator [Euryarchaeota archaeon]
MENTRTHFIRRRHGASESELNSGPAVSMLPIGNKWKSSSVRSDCPSVEGSSFRPRKRLMERKDSQTSKGKKERNSRKASVRTGPKGEALVEISPALASLFRDFSDRSLEFSREVIERSGVAATTNNDRARLNIRIARTVFGKWSVEILTFLYSARVARFQELRKALGDISARVLSLKLARLEGLGFVHRAVIDTRPPGVEYSLTEKGREVAKLGEPVFLYLRLMEGSLNQTRR